MEGKAGRRLTMALTHQQAVQVAVSPNFANDSTVFAGSYYCGLYKSSDRGLAWSQIFTGDPYAQVQAVAISPNYVNDATVFIGGEGLYKSTDGGQSWLHSPVAVVRSVAISTNYINDATVFAGTWGYGAYKSTNGGQSWAQVNTGLPLVCLFSRRLSQLYQRCHRFCWD